ncbi:MAG: hypothetical protein OCD76_14040 [Reichenbachiella sp.]
MKGRVVFKSVLLCVIFLHIICVSDIAKAQKPELKFQSIKSGLTSLGVSAILQDKYGFLWIGTHSGLQKYDGIKFTSYLANLDGTGPNSDYIHEIYEDKNGSLWVGTTNGICRFDRKKDRFISYRTQYFTPEGQHSYQNRISSIIEDLSGTLWVSSDEEGLFRLNRTTDQFEAIEVGPGARQLNSNDITGLEIDGDGNLWIGTYDKGLNIRNSKTGLVTKGYDFGLNSSADKSLYLWSIEKGVDGEMWIGSRYNGLFLAKTLEDGQVSFKQYLHNESDPMSLGNNSIFTIYLDSKKRLWIGNENGGLHLYNRQEDNFYRYCSNPADPLSLSHNSIWSIYEDREERIWIGTALQGLNYYDKYYSKFSHYYQRPGDENSLNNNVIRAFWEEPDGNIWIATDGGGLNYFNRKEENFNNYRHDVDDPTSPTSNAMLTITEDNDGKLWIGTWGGGICVLKDKGEMLFEPLELKNYPDSHTSNHYSLLKDKEGNIWSANFNVGLSVYDWQTKNFKTYFPENDVEGSLKGGLVKSLCLDSEGDIWIGSESYGVNKLVRSDTAEYFKLYVSIPNDSTTLSNAQVNHVFEDSRKTVWIATNQGLSRYNRETEDFRRFTMQDGLPSNSVLSIVEDDYDNLWMGTLNGLVRFNLDTYDMTSFGIDDGIQGKEFSRYSAKKLSTGELIFGGMNGFNIFYPDSVLTNPYLPKVYLTDFKIFNEPVEIDGLNSPLKQHITVTNQIELNYKQSVFSFEFTALNFTRSDQNMFAFKLEGLEENWNYVGLQRNASYSNLNPGEYVFRVKAANNDGLWNEEGASLIITVLPPWWLTWWAYVIWIVGVFSMMYVVVIVRTSYLRNQRKQLQELVANRTEELEEKNKHISMQAEELHSYNDALNDLNDNLEKTVQVRTNELLVKNKKLAEYAFINAHNLRVPVANIKGLIQLFEVDRSNGEMLELIDVLKGESHRLDTVLIDIKDMLEKDESMAQFKKNTDHTQRK